MNDDTKVEVESLPSCDICAAAPAAYDGKTLGGSWAYMCEPDFARNGVGLGLGRGQRLIKRGSNDE